MLQNNVANLTEIIKMNELGSLTVIHMQASCCSGLTHIAKGAIAGSGVNLLFQDITTDLQGNIIKIDTIN